MSDTIKKKSILDDIKTRPHKSPAQKRQITVTLIILLGVLAVGGGAYYFLMPRESMYKLKSYDSAEVRIGDLVRKIQAGGTVVVPVQMSVAAPDIGEAGYARYLYVREGDYVEKGQLLAVISVPFLEDELFDLQEDLEEETRNYEQFIQQNRFSEARLDRELARMETEIADAEEEVKRQELLTSIHAVRKIDMDRAVKQLEQLIDSYHEKNIQLEETIILNRISEDSRAAVLERYRKSISRLETLIESSEIRSPIAGDVIAVDSRLGVPGSSISKGQELLTIADRTSAVIELEVPEQYSGMLSGGQIVTLTIGGRQLQGEINTIGRVASVSSDGIQATVKVTITPQEDSDLIPGSTVLSEIIIGTTEQVMVLPRGPYLTTGSQRYLYVINEGRAVKTAVTFGEIQSEHVQILRGVEPGDKVIISGYQNYIEHAEITLQGATP